MVNKATSKPPTDYSDSQWQQDFIRIKKTIKPSDQNKMKVIPDTKSSSGVYYGKTQYQYYCDFINDILFNIRHGKCDYCFYIYQIAELLKYEYYRLQAVWLSNERCFKISLKNNMENYNR